MEEATTRSRTRRRRLGAAAIALAALGAWLALRPGPGAASTAPRADAAMAVRASRVPAASPATVAVPAHVAAAAAPAHADDAACVAPSWPSAHPASDADGHLVIMTDAPRLTASVAAARARIEARLRASADPYANAVAVWLAAPPDDDPDGRATAERRRRLAALAVETRDPRLYALALRACWREGESACPSLSARRWAELDPGNAMPWALLADEAAARADASGLQEAMFRMGQSARIEDRDYAPLQPVVDAVGDDADLAGAQSLAIDAIGIAAAQPWPLVATRCRHATPADANAWQQCRAIVDLLENRGDSLMLRSAGAWLDRRLTGATAPARRVDALFVRWAREFPAAPSGCAAMRQGLALLRDAAVRGQAAAAGADAP